MSSASTVSHSPPNPFSEEAFLSDDFQGWSLTMLLRCYPGLLPVARSFQAGLL